MIFELLPGMGLLPGKLAVLTKMEPRYVVTTTREARYYLVVLHTSH